MEEIDKNKMSELEKDKFSGKKEFMTALTANTVRELVRYVNELEIKKNDIVTILKENSQFILVYYKQEK